MTKAPVDGPTTASPMVATEALAAMLLPESTTASPPLTQTLPTTPAAPLPQIKWSPQVTIVANLAPAWSPNGNALAFHSAEGLVVAYAPDFAPQTIFAGPALGAMWEEPGLLWQPDGTQIVFRTSTERIVDGQLLEMGTLDGVTREGSDLRDLLPGWKATLSGPSYAVGLEG
jgi:hypothetical protein